MPQLVRVGGLITPGWGNGLSGGSAPTGYAVVFTTDPISDANASAAAIQITSAQVGSTYNYTITSSGGGSAVNGSGSIATATQSVTGINVSGLNDGTLTVSITLTNGSGTGSPATDTVTKLWLPTDISGLSLWLDASDTSSITHTANAVSQWNDKSGNAYHATQATGSRQPTTNTRTVNTRNVIDFDGSSDGMTVASGAYAIPAGANTILAVIASDNAGDASQDIIVSQIASTGTRQQVGFTSTNLVVQNRTTSNSATLYAWTRNTNTRIVGYNRSGTSITPIIDGVAGTAGTNAENTASLTFMTIGALQSFTANRFDGVIAEIIWYSASLTTAQMNRAGAALAAKWGGTWTGL